MLTERVSHVGVMRLVSTIDLVALLIAFAVSGSIVACTTFLLAAALSAVFLVVVEWVRLNIVERSRGFL